MSHVIFQDTSQFIAEDAQNIGGRTLARKHLKIKSLAKIKSCTLFVLAASTSSKAPLQIRVNNRQMGAIEPVAARIGRFFWYAVPVKRSLLKTGVNRIALECPDGLWQLALTGTENRSQSYRSDDGGRTWLNRQLGRYHAVKGEYVIRLRVEDGSAARFPRFVYEKSNCPELKMLRDALPASLKTSKDTWTAAKKLSSYIARSLRYYNALDSGGYAPWNYFEIMHDNARNIKARKANKPIPSIVMCVHFTVAFVQAATALGMRCRCIVSTQGMGTGNGHFFPEVYLSETDTWAVIDPTIDGYFVDDDGRPMSVMAIHANRNHLKKALRLGPAAKCLGERQTKFIVNSVKNGSTYANISYWRRNDFFGAPQFCPTYHGAVIYYEPDLVWIAGDDPLIGAFVYDYREDKNA